MFNIGVGLSDEEIEALCKLPRIKKSEVYARAEAWLDANIDKLTREHPGKYLYMDAKTLLYIIDDSFDKAAARCYGPLPREGRHVLGLQLK